jgi:CRP/FNR family transcriptional regulator, cyclic AMP receptor protein
MDKVSPGLGKVVAPAMDFFLHLPEAERAELLSSASRRELNKGELIFKVGDPTTHVYVLESGRAKVYHPSPGGKEVLLWFCFPWELFGLAEAGHGERRQATAQLCERSTLVSIPCEDFQAFVRTHPAAALLVIDLLSLRVRSLGNTLQELVASDVTARVIMLLTRLSACYGKTADGEVCLDLDVTQQELADMVGATRQTVSSTLSMLKRSGVIHFKNRRICIPSEALLMRMAAGTRE